MIAMKRVVGMVWYTRESYTRIRQIMSDGETLPAEFDTWIRKAEHTFKLASANGQIVIKAVLEPDAFQAFCAERHLNLDSQARLDFANSRARDEAHRF